MITAEIKQKNRIPHHKNPPSFSRTYGALTFTMGLLFSLNTYAAPLRVVATTSDLASIAQDIGGKEVSVTALSAGTLDPHHVEPRPSMVQHLRHADAIIVVGMDLDGWSDSLIRVSQNPKIQLGNKGYISASEKITALEVPTGKIDGRQGDIHLHGNPHYWLDPLNGIQIARTITERLSEIAPDKASLFQKNLSAFEAQINARLPEWQAAIAPLKGKSIVAYHPTWSYFTKRFGLTIDNYIEPLPGISPSISDIMALEKRMLSKGSKLIIVESYSPKKEADRLSERTGAQVVILAPSVKGLPGTETYLTLFDYNISQLKRSIQ